MAAMEISMPARQLGGKFCLRGLNWNLKADSRRRQPAQQSFYTQIFIYIRPMNPIPGAGYLPSCALLGCCMQ